jgi:hypothetical protein
VPFVRSQIGPARWQLRRDQPGSSDWLVHLRPNDCQLRARLINVVRREQGVWLQQARLQMQVTQGVLDSVTLEVPESWRDNMPQGTQSRVSYARASQPGMVRATLWSESAQFDPALPIEVGGPIPVSPGQPLSIPNIRLLAAGQIERQLFLPISLDGQPILWSTAGLQPLDGVELPAELAQPGATYQALLVPAGPFQATRLPAKSSVGTPAVPLVDVHIAWLGRGAYEGLALFDLLPDGLHQCQIDFPSGVEPMAVYLDDLPIRLEREAQPDEATTETAARIEIKTVELTSNELPQRVRVLFRGQVAVDRPATDNPLRLNLHVPVLKFSDPTSSPTNQTAQPLPVGRTLWTLYEMAPNRVALEHTVSSDTLDRHRLAHLDALLDRAAQMTTDFSPDDLQRWYSVWGRRFLATLRRVESTERGADERRELSDEEIAAALTDHTRAASQLNVDPVWQRLQSVPEVRDTTRVWLDALPDPLNVQRIETENGPTSLPVDVQALGTGGRGWRRAGAVLMALVGLALHLLGVWPSSRPTP